MIRSKSVINKNLFVTISQDQGESKYSALIKYLRHNIIKKIGGILVYCRTKKIVEAVFYYLSNSR